MIAGYMVDVSNPQNWNFTGTSVIPDDQHHLPRCNAFYIGGNTPHVWSDKQIQTQSNPYRLPIWVYDPFKTGGNMGATHGRLAVAACKKLGMPANSGLFICLDMETFVDLPYSKAFHDEIHNGGYWYVPYESESVTGNFIGEGGRWGAHWTNVAHIETDDWATQYANSAQLGHPFDISAVSSFEHLWNFIGAVPNPPIPPPVTVSFVTVTYSDGTTAIFKPPVPSP